MTDLEKLLVALHSEDDEPVGHEVSVLDVIMMLDELGADYRRAARRAPVLVGA